MKWFKHYSSASSSMKLQKLRNRKRGKEIYCEYWMLLELLCEKFNGEDTKILLSWKEVATKLEVRSNRVGTILELFASLNLIELDKVGTELEINAPILLELKDKDFTRSRRARDIYAEDTQNKSAKNKIKNKDKEEDKEKEINKEKICSFQNLENSISFTEVTNLFNQKLPREFSNKGRVKYAPNFANNTLLEKFDQILGHTDFKGPEGWIRLFNEVLESDFLMGISEKNFVVTLDWLLDTSNIRKVLGGQYSNGKDFARQESDARLNKMLDEYYANKVD